MWTKLRKIKFPHTTVYVLLLASSTCTIGRFAQSTVPDSRPLEWPETSAGELIITHSGFSLGFDTLHRQARWVAYVLTASRAAGEEPRANRFYPDPQLPGLTATDADYRKSGFDRGHLAPAADMAWSAESLRESFYYSNVSPQRPEFNRGIWKRLENQVRVWAHLDSVIYVVTGPVLNDSLKRLNNTRISVPLYFYKALLVYTRQNKKCIGFIMPNERSTQPLALYAVSVDSLEQFTGINFFPELPDSEEAVMEKSLCLPCWNMKPMD